MGRPVQSLLAMFSARGRRELGTTFNHQSCSLDPMLSGIKSRAMLKRLLVIYV